MELKELYRVARRGVEKSLKDTGNAGVALAIATTAITLMVVVIVVGKFSSVNTGLSGAGLAGFNNVTDFTWSGLTIAALGVIVLAGMGILSYFGMGMGRRGRR